VAFLIAGLGQPAHAQGSLFEKFKKVSRTITKKAGQADTVLTAMEQTTAAAECLASEDNCPEQPEEQEPQEAEADSSGIPSASSSSAAPVISEQDESEPRAPPDSSEA
jgi:hypothetical protein